MPRRIVAPYEQFFLSLTAVHARVHRLAEAILLRSGITVAEYTLLRIVENTPGITAAQARRRLFATAPSIAQLVSHMEAKRLVRRVRDRIDARKLHLQLTPIGQRAVRRGKSSLERLIGSLPLPSRTWNRLTADLEHLLSSLPSHGT